jgi:hypothetical protein
VLLRSLFSARFLTLPTSTHAPLVKMTDYSSLKVPELKKLLGERSLPISGNKSDLIARLQEHDKKPTSTTGM